MSTQPQLSPLEQLEQQSAQAQPQSQAAPDSNLSPLEQLEQMSAKPQAGPTDAQGAYRKAVAADPYAPAGAAEKAMGQEMGSNSDQAWQAAKSTGMAVAATGLGVAGASAAPEILPTAERFLQMSENALEHLAENYPQLTKLATKLGYGAGAAGAYKLLNKLGIH